MAKIKQLKDKSGTEQIFPKTKTQAIYNTDGTLLSETLDDLYGSLATIESSPTTTSHSVGEYILYQGRVYKVTSVIASGDSLVVGTNISAVNLGNQISTLNGQVSTLNSKSTVQNLSSQISVTSAITLQSDCFLLRFGNLCVLQMRFRLNAATTENTKIAQLPVHPYNNNGNGHVSLAFKIWGLNTDTITTYIKPDGSVNISVNATTGNDYILQTTFMCAN